MKNIFLFLASVTFFISSCSKKLDDVPQPFNDNPYDNDYTGPRVVRIDNIVHIATSGFRNELYYTKLHANNEGIRLYRNGILINTHYNHTAHTVFIADNTTISGSVNTYVLEIFSGSGRAESDPVTFTTP